MSAADIYDRVSDVFNTLFRDFEKPLFAENAVMVTHGMTIRLFLMRWFHLTVTEFEHLANPNNSDILVMELQENGIYLITPLQSRKVIMDGNLKKPGGSLYVFVNDLLLHFSFVVFINVLFVLYIFQIPLP